MLCLVSCLVSCQVFFQLFWQVLWVVFWLVFFPVLCQVFPQVSSKVPKLIFYLKSVLEKIPGNIIFRKKVCGSFCYWVLRVRKVNKNTCRFVNVPNVQPDYYANWQWIEYPQLFPWSLGTAWRTPFRNRDCGSNRPTSIEFLLLWLVSCLCSWRDHSRRISIVPFHRHELRCAPRQLLISRTQTPSPCNLKSRNRGSLSRVFGRKWRRGGWRRIWKGLWRVHEE